MATDIERGILVQRATEAAKAEADYVLAQNRANEVFGLFCAAHGLPTGCLLVGTDKSGNIILDLPADGKPAKDETPNAGAEP